MHGRSSRLAPSEFRTRAVSTLSEVSNGRTVLMGSTNITAKDHTAAVTLSRGGEVRVCATSGLHVTVGKSSSAKQPLMLALDRGALEVQMPAINSDVVMTPDLRFATRGDGPLDLYLRVTTNGDTCVENRGADAPTLNVSDQFARRHLFVWRARGSKACPIRTWRARRRSWITRVRRCRELSSGASCLGRGCGGDFDESCGSGRCRCG